MGKILFHIDVNSAYLSWEAVYRLKHLGGSLDLREIPSAVGGDQAMRHGIILAKSVPAKKYGIQTGESIPEALRKCPGLMLVPPNYNLYQRSSRAFVKILKEYTPVIEQYSIDEVFMDMTGTEQLFGRAEELAERIRDRIYRELGFTVNIGVSDHKILAKMASDFRKPDMVHTLWKSEIPKKMWGLPVRDLFFVGRATGRKLEGLGIHTIGELAETEPEILKAHLKKHGEVIWRFANGLDEDVVLDTPPPQKGYGNSTTVAFDVTERETGKMVLLSLAETLAARMRADQGRAAVISVGIRDYEFRYYSHQMKLRTPTNITWEVYEAACQLFDEMWDRAPVRHLGIHASGISYEPIRQLSLFDTLDYERLERADRMVDEIRRRFGHDAVMRGGFVNRKNLLIDHMSGGISREKRAVDYSRQDIR